MPVMSEKIRPQYLAYSGPLEQFVDQPVALVRAAVGQERSHFVRRRERADQVEIHATQEDVVGRKLRRADVQLSQPLAHDLVERIVRRKGGKLHAVIGPRHEHLAGGDCAAVGGDDRRVAGVGGGDQAGLADGGHALVARSKRGQRRDVFERAVREAGGELNCGRGVAGAKQQFARRDL